MVAAVAITRQTHMVEELRALAATGMDRQAVRDRVQRYNAEGPEGLRDGGSRPVTKSSMLR